MVLDGGLTVGRRDASPCHALDHYRPADPSVTIAYVPAIDRSSDFGGNKHGDIMKPSNTRNSFRYRRMAGSHHHTYSVEIRGLGYRISLGGRLLRRSAAGMLSEDADINAVVRSFAISDIENLVGMRDG